MHQSPIRQPYILQNPNLFYMRDHGYMNSIQRNKVMLT